MYVALLGLHSWIRWILVIAAVLLLIKSWQGKKSTAAYASGDKTLADVFIWSLNIQFILGIVLFAFFSPITKVAFNDFGAAMGDSSLRFFLIEHPFSMLLALGVAHAFMAKAKREDDVQKKHGLIFKGVAISFFFILAGIPWPFLPYGRMLFFL